MFSSNSNSNIPTPNMRPNPPPRMHQTSPEPKQNSSITCSTHSKDTMTSSSPTRHTMLEAVADIGIGPDGSDVYMPRGKMVKNSFGWGFSRAMVT